MHVRMVCLVWMMCGVGSACPADPRVNRDRHVAKVGSENIAASELFSTLARRGTARIADPAARRAVAAAIVDELANERVLLAAAQQAGIHVRDDEVDREVRGRAQAYPPGAFQRLLVAEQRTLADFKASVRRRLIQDALIRMRLGPPPPVTVHELESRYAAEHAHRTAMRGDQVRARHILVKTQEEALLILDQLRSRRVQFDEAAQRMSISPDAERSGDLGWFARGDMPDAFDVCFNLAVGVVSDVVSSDYGFHLFQVLERRDAVHETFAEARDRLAFEIQSERQDAAYARLMGDLRAQFPVVIDEEAVTRVVSLLPPPPLPGMTAPDFRGDQGVRSGTASSHVRVSEGATERPVLQADGDGQRGESVSHVADR